MILGRGTWNGKVTGHKATVRERVRPGGECAPSQAEYEAAGETYSIPEFLLFSRQGFFRRSIFPPDHQIHPVTYRSLDYPMHLTFPDLFGPPLSYCATKHAWDHEDTRLTRLHVTYLQLVHRSIDFAWRSRSENKINTWSKVADGSSPPSPSLSPFHAYCYFSW